MKRILLFFAIVCSLLGEEASARPRHYYNNGWHEPGNILVSLGYRPMDVGIGNFGVGEAKFEYIVLDTDIDYVNLGFTGSLAKGPHFFEMDFIGLIMQGAWSITINTISDGFATGGYTAMAALIFSVPILSNLNFHIPVYEDIVEVNVGWNLLKLSKFTNPDQTYYEHIDPTGTYRSCSIYDKWFLNGSFNIGANIYHRDIYINPYWEYNFGYYKAANFLSDKLDIGRGNYPYKGFQGNYFGIRVGYQF